MKKQYASIENLIVFILTGAISVAIIFALGNSVLDLRVIKKTFSDPDLGVSFQYPANFQEKSTKSGDITYIDVYPSYNDRYEPKFIEIVIAKDNETNVNLNDQIALMLNQTGSSRMTRIHKGTIEGVQFTRSTGTDRSIYTFYKANENLIMVKFNQQYYGVNNPLVLNNNSQYMGVYYSLINSLQIN